MFFALLVGIDFQTGRLDADAYGNPTVFKQMQAVVAVEIRDIGNHADIQAFVFDRRTGSQAAYGLFEECGVVQRAVVRQVGDFAAAVIKREAVFAFDVFAVACFGRIKRNRTGQQGRQRGGIEFDTTACGFDINAAFQPKTAGGINQFVVGALNENGVMHALVGRVEMRAFYLTDHKVFIQNRAADVEDAVVFADQIQAQAALTDGGNRRNVLDDKYIFGFLAFTRCKCNI